MSNEVVSQEAMEQDVLGQELTEQKVVPNQEVVNLKLSIVDVILSLQVMEKRFEEVKDDNTSEDLMENYPLHMGTIEDMILGMQKWEASL